MKKKSKKNPSSLPSTALRQSQPAQPGQRQLEAHLETFQGPLPKPSFLQEYNNIVPGAAERIISMAEKQAEHRQSMEKIVISGDSRRAFCGLWVGAGVALCVLGGAIFLIYTGHDVAGAVIGGLDIASLVSVFVYGTVSRRLERVQKAAIMARGSRPHQS